VVEGESRWKGEKTFEWERVVKDGLFSYFSWDNGVGVWERVRV
jgi:hypothetical protein